METNYWLVKQEPSEYSWQTFQKEGACAWTGVRNYQARNNLRNMKKADFVFFYHSGEDAQLVGLARVAKAAYPDPTATDGDWSAVDLKPVKSLKRPVSLTTIKSTASLADLPLLRQSRLSVTSLTKAQFDRLLALAETELDG